MDDFGVQWQQDDGDAHVAAIEKAVGRRRFSHFGRFGCCIG